MKIAYCSDLHLEFGDIELKNDENVDVLIIAGDLLLTEFLHNNVPEDVKPTDILFDKNWGQSRSLAFRFRSFLDRINKEFPKTFIIAGNHEFYHGKWFATLDYLRDEYSRYSNIVFLENNYEIIDDVVFIGGTLWTDMNRCDPGTLFSIKYALNDFSLIRNDKKKFSTLTPEDTVIRHRKTLKFIENTVNKFKDKINIVIGHHSPSNLSIHPKYKDDYEMNGGYSSSLTQFIYDHSQIKCWLHGHTHMPFDYFLGDTRILCNPRGYASREQSAKNFELKIIEV